jgi:Nucleotidyltransferase/DNA polymerase involved in DNA repair
VLTTASYEARKYGVRSGMPGESSFIELLFGTVPNYVSHQGFIAKKLCPDLIFVGNNFSRYQEMSEKIMSIFKRYDPHMCVAGCDEGYLK